MQKVVEEKRSRSSAYYSESSEDSDGTPRSRGRRALCSSRNALLARENRRKKKAYVKGLEMKIMDLKQDAKKLRGVLGTQVTQIEELQSEIKYLKATLANAADIGSLVKRIRGPVQFAVAESKLPSTLTEPRPLSPLDLDFPECDYPLVFEDVDFSLQNNNENIFEPVRSLPGKRMPAKTTFSDHNYSTMYGSDEETPNNIGVCLHVSNKKMSLEFCSKCNESAIRNWARDEA